MLATGTPAELLQRTDSRSLEEAFIALLPEEKKRGHAPVTIAPLPEGGEDDFAVLEHVGTPRDFESEGFEPRDHIELGKLLGDGLFHRFAGISQIDVPKPANRIHRLMPVNVGDPHALSRSQDHRQVCLAVGGMRHRMPDLARVHLAQEIIVKTLASGHAALPQTANGF